MSETDLDALIEQGEALGRAGDHDGAIAFFKRLVMEWPAEPRAHFALGGAFDSAGREVAAIGPYRLASELGLGGDDLPRWYVQLGSTLRNAGDLDGAITLLREGKDRFPDDAAIPAFLALALHAAGQHAAALVETFDLLLRDPEATGLGRYQRSLPAYADDLRGDGHATT